MQQTRLTFCVFFLLFWLLQVFGFGFLIFLSSCRELDECENLEKMSQGQDLKSHLSVGDADETRKSDLHEVC